MRKKNFLIVLTLYSCSMVLILYSCSVERKVIFEGKSVAIFQAWTNMDYSENSLEDIAKHNLIISDTWLFDIGFIVTKDQPYEMLSTELDLESIDNALKIRSKLLGLNPDILILSEIYYREGNFLEKERHLPKDSKYWIRTKNGDVAPAWGEDLNADGEVTIDEIESGLIDFTNSEFQDLVVKKAIALEQSGLFDGVMFDWWSETSSTTASLDWSFTYLTLEEEIDGRISLLKKIRKNVSSDFLIIVNTNDNKILLSAPYVNGAYMECYKDIYNIPYKYEHIKKIEKTLIWAEENLREPRINSLEGWRVVKNLDESLKITLKERETKENLRWMRLFTTMSLTLSDGYVLFSDDNALPRYDHGHNYYKFWQNPIGLSISKKKILFQNFNDVYIREYENAVVIYNGSKENIEFILGKKYFNTVTKKYGKSFKLDSLDGTILMKKEK